MKQHQLLIAVASVAIAGCSSVKISHAGYSEKLNDTYYYVLPKTAFSLEVPVKTTTFTLTKQPGEASQILKDSLVLDYCVKRFGLDKDLLANLVKSAKPVQESELSELGISAVARPDYTKRFRVKARSRFLSDYSTSFTYSGDGIASQSEASYQNNTLAVAGKFLDGVVSIVGGMKGFAEPDGKMDGTPDLSKYPLLKSLDELAGEYIHLRLAPPDIIEAALYKERLRMQEEVMRQKFTELFYTEKVQTKTLRIVYCPSLPEKDTVKLFRLVNGCIYVNAALQADVEVYGLADYRFATIADDTCYKLSLTRKDKALGNYMNSYDSTRVSGYVYNVPANFILTLTNDQKQVVAMQPVKLPQFGTLGTLSRKQSKVSIEWNPETGELKKVSGESKGVSKDDVSGTSAAVKSAIDAARGDDETTRLEKEVKLLELRKKLEELKAIALD